MAQRGMGQRIVAITLAGVFLLTSVGIGVIIAWQAFVDDGNSTQNQNPGQDQQQTLAGTQLEGFTPAAEVEELQVTDAVEGEGKEVKAGDTVAVDYTGAVAATGIIFESSLDVGQSVTFPLDAVIKGWGEGLVGMKEGGERRLLIPADLAYGDNPPPGSGIPAGAALVFDVTLHAVNPPEPEAGQ